MSRRFIASKDTEFYASFKTMLVVSIDPESYSLIASSPYTGSFEVGGTMVLPDPASYYAIAGYEPPNSWRTSDYIRILYPGNSYNVNDFIADGYATGSDENGYTMTLYPVYFH